MKKLLTIIMAFVFALCSFGLVACENNGGNFGDGGDTDDGKIMEGTVCQHSIGTDGVCTLCGKDILAKWKTVFDDIEAYRYFTGKEYKLVAKEHTKVYYSSSDGPTEVRWKDCVEIIETGNNKLYEKNYDLNSDGSVDEDSILEYYYEYLPEEDTMIEYKRAKEWQYYNVPVGTWIKSSTSEEFEVSGLYVYLGLVKSMVPSKIEYVDDALRIYYSLYNGKLEFIFTFEDDLVTRFELKQDEMSMIAEITYGDVNIVLPDATEINPD